MADGAGAQALTMVAMVMRHGSHAQLVHCRPPLGPNTMRRTEAMLQILTAGAIRRRGDDLRSAESPERVAGQRPVWRGEVNEAQAVFERLLALSDERGEIDSYVWA